jgi:HK97 gp10 family phage protein
MVRVQIDQVSVDRLIKELEKLPSALRDDTRKKILRSAAKPLIEAARSNIKDSKSGHTRYARSQKGKRLPKGQGKKIATYKPGNLRRSIGIISLRKSSNVFVGPRFKKSPSGDYSGGRYDGYYAWILHEYGGGGKKGRGTPNPFMRKAYDQTGGMVIKLIESGVRTALEKHIRENGLNR